MSWVSIGVQYHDLAILVCGYERRATYIYEKLRGQIQQAIVIDYVSRGVLAYDHNRNLFLQDATVTMIEYEEAKFGESLALLVKSALDSKDEDEKLRVVFDVSSGSRRLMSIVLKVLDSVCGGRLDLTCLYSLSEFYQPPTSELPSHISEPVIGDLSGWSDDLTKPPCAIIGLGFEPGRAIGCLDYLEIPEARLFVPFGPEPRFVEAVLAANEMLIREAGREFVLPYSVMHPLDIYSKMESLLHGLISEFRPVIIPLGPKIFSAVSIVLAMRFAPRVCVWRTSAGSLGRAVDVPASGQVAVFSVGSISAPRGSGTEDWSEAVEAV